MCDWAADPVWNAPSVPRGTMDGFKVSAPLWARLLRWYAWWSQHDPLFDGALDEAPGFDLTSFMVEGYMIGQAVKAELPDWAVIVSDASLYRYAGRGMPGLRPFDVEIPAHLH